MANGNCLYNACSIALTGNDHRISGILRCLTSIELYEHALYYANHPVIKLQYENGAFTSLKNAFAMCLSDTALSVFEKYDNTAAVIEEAKHNAHNYEFSSMMCMFALTTVIDCTIQSYYPITNDSASRQDWDSLAKMFNCSIYPRQFLDGDFLENVHIFRCAAMPQRYLVDREIPTRKNHFVTLCQPIDDVELGEHYFLPKFPMLPPPPKAIDGHAGPSSISKLMPIGTKRKLSLDSLLPKKKVNDKEEPMIPSSSSTNETTDNNSIKSGNFEVKLITNTTSSTAVNTGCPKDINNILFRYPFQMLKSMSSFLTHGNLFQITHSLLIRILADVFSTAGYLVFHGWFILLLQMVVSVSIVSFLVVKVHTMLASCND